MNSDTADPAQSLSLKGLHAALEERGVRVPYSSLSQFIALGDIAEQLGVGGKGNRREFPPEAAEILAVVLPKFEAAKLGKDHAPAFVRHQIHHFRGSENSITPTPTPLDAPDDVNYEVMVTSELVPRELVPISSQEILEIGRAIQEFIAAVKDLAPVREDSTLNRRQAAVLLTCAPSSVSRFVRPLRRGVYRRSDVMRYIASGVPQRSSP